MRSESREATMGIVRDVVLAIFFLWIFVDAVVVFRHKTAAAENRDRRSLKLLMVGSLLAYAVSIGLAFGTIGAIDSVTLQIAGLVVMALGIAVRSTAIRQLGRFHTPNVAVRTDHRLKQSGLYRHVRHPSYLGALIAYLGFSLALGNWLSVAVLMGTTTALYLYRMHEEDAALADAFGEAYRAYARRTKRLIPWLY
jgi:protein-S-isoprenylcysteine O-methyltransferase